MKKSIVILLHILFWDIIAALLILFAEISMSLNESLTPLYMFKLMLGMIIIPCSVSFYLFYFKGFDFLRKKKIGLLVVMALTMSLFAALDGAIFLSIMFGSDFMFNDGWTSFFQELVFIEILALLVGVIGLVLRVFIEWYGDIRIKEELTQKNHETELALVKSQLDPHFLFNTINNIDVLIQKDGVKASQYLNKLSDIMRFMLYEAKADEIPLKDEITYIEKYLELQRIRTSNPNYVNFSCTGNVQNLQVAPMLFIPFIENAFKHAGNKKADDAIQIDIKVGAKDVNFKCTNVVSDKAKVGKSERGVGMELIQKRLELMYPERHELKVLEKGNQYVVNLKLNFE